ncbi:MAG: protein kinase [Clostridiales bacterium]|nr:protein kinase [Clostridiales bacterium]
MGDARGATINGYTLLEDFQNTGSARWTFARKNGRDYFLKEYIAPVYPREGTMSPELRQEYIAECRQFEGKKRQLYGAINGASDGNLVRVLEFFRFGTHYYTVSERVNSSNMTPERIQGWPLADRILLCRGLAHSMMGLHRQRVIHSDIKAENVLVKRTVTGRLAAKVIDFDCSFFENDPPKNEDDLGGDQVYLSPEAYVFLCGGEIELTCKMDVFALGLLFHEYLTGALPDFDRERYDYAHQAVLNGQELVLSQKLDERWRSLLSEMLRLEPDDRISIAEAYERLGEDSPGPETRERAEEARAEPEPVRENQKEKGNPWYVPTDL